MAEISKIAPILPNPLSNSKSRLKKEFISLRHWSPLIERILSINYRKDLILKGLTQIPPVFQHIKEKDDTGKDS